MQVYIFCNKANVPNKDVKKTLRAATSLIAILGQIRTAPNVNKKPGQFQNRKKNLTDIFCCGKSKGPPVKVWSKYSKTFSRAHA